MGTDRRKFIMISYFILLFYYSINLSVSFVNCFDSSASTSKYIQRPRVTESPIVFLLPHYIDPYLIQNVTTRVGQTTYLDCNVQNFSRREVSWIRLKDMSLLAVGSNRHTNDTRFSPWYPNTLKIRYPQVADEGLYACQISSVPFKNIYFRLLVVAAEAQIAEGPDMYVEVGGSINLTCSIMQSPEQPVFVFWSHEEELIWNTIRSSVTIQKEDRNTSVSRLSIRNALPSDSGNYSCIPSNTDRVSILVHVTEDEPRLRRDEQSNITDSITESMVAATEEIFP